MPTLCFLSCSIAKKINIVNGPNLAKLGNQPLNINDGPSVRKAVVNIFIADLVSLPLEFMIRVLMTSAGEQIVVATNPASRDAEKCVELWDGLNWNSVTR